MQKKYRRFAACAVFALLTLGGCAPKNWDSEENGAFDPLEGFNRQTYKFNKGIDFILLKPAAKLYQHTPPPLQKGVNNFFSNAGEPSNIVNNALQRKGTAAVSSLARFTFNSVLGVGGMFDVATAMGLEEQRTNLGNTLREYKLHHTMYVVLPLVGPGSAADHLGRGGDQLLFNPAYYINDTGAVNTVYAVDGVNKRAQLITTTDLLEDIAVLDEYAFVRDSYEERRLNNTSSYTQDE